VKTKIDLDMISDKNLTSMKCRIAKLWIK